MTKNLGWLVAMVMLGGCLDVVDNPRLDAGDDAGTTGGPVDANGQDSATTTGDSAVDADVMDGGEAGADDAGGSTGDDSGSTAGDGGCTEVDWYADVDGDGKGAGDPTRACDPPDDGWVDEGGDPQPLCSTDMSEDCMRGDLRCASGEDGSLREACVDLPVAPNCFFWSAHTSCSEATPICEGDGRCVECLDDGNCTADQPLCEAGVCTDCTAEACMSYEATPVCDEGASGGCVQCVPGEDASECTGATPVCADDATHCVACNVDGHCETPAAPVCTDHACEGCTGHGDCARFGSTPLCSSDSDSCVECNADSDCKTPGKARCAAHQCVPCTADAQCEGGPNPGLDVCFNGSCVDCRLDPLPPGDPMYDALENSKRELGCMGNNSCNPATRTCTSTKQGSVDVCNVCVSDSECDPGHRCVEMTYDPGGENLPQGGRCLRDKTAGCVQPYSHALTSQSLSGESATVYCGVPTTSSCDAILELGKACPGGEGDCSEAGGVCREVGTIANACTYACQLVSDCPVSAPCVSGYCGGS